jgi:hypothetical protein
VILSLLVGVVTIEMQSAMTEMHESNLRQLRDERLQLSHKNQPIVYTRYVYGGRSRKVLQYDVDSGLPQVELLEPVISKKPRVGQRARGRLNRATASAKKGPKPLVEEEEFVFGAETKTRATMAHLMKMAIRGKAEIDPSHMPGNPLQLSDQQHFGLAAELYLAVGQQCRVFVASDLYSLAVVVLIAMYAMLVGIETSVRNNPTVKLLQTVCVWVFASECVVKIVAEGTKPWAFFHDGWNVFDFVIASGGVVTLVSGASTNPVIQLARLLRLVQFFKLAGRLPRLQLVMESLLYGMRSMVWVLLLFALFNYLFAIGGMIMFRDNDPFFFGSIQKSLATLWMVETFNNWEGGVDALFCSFSLSLSQILTPHLFPPLSLASSDVRERLWVRKLRVWHLQRRERPHGPYFLPAARGVHRELCERRARRGLFRLRRHVWRPRPAHATHRGDHGVHGAHGQKQRAARGQRRESGRRGGARAGVLAQAPGRLVCRAL